MNHAFGINDTTCEFEFIFEKALAP
jgi:hypothetical protein